MRREIICLILWNILTSALPNLKGSGWKQNGFSAKRRLREGAADRVDGHSKFYLYLLAQSPRTIQNIKMELLERSKMFVARCNFSCWMCGWSMDFSLFPDSVVSCFHSRNGMSAWQQLRVALSSSLGPWEDVCLIVSSWFSVPNLM